MSRIIQRLVEFDVDDMAQRGRIGGLTNSSRHDPWSITDPGRAAFLAGFIDLVDPDRVLPEAERTRRAKAALQAHMARLARRSVEARPRRTGGSS